VDLQLYARVLWRFRVVVAAGLVLALALAFFSYVSFGFSKGFQYRQSQEWLSSTTLLVTQQGAPELRTVPGDPETGVYADSSRLAGLAALYATLVDSDGVRALMADKNPPPGRIVASPVTTQDGLSLPLITLEALAATPAGALQLAQVQASSFIDFIEREQGAENIASKDRVEVKVVSQPTPPFVFTPRSKAVPIVIFLSVLVATFALVFVLENLRPRMPRLEAAAHERTAA
jgi:hypothetical protein